MKQFTMSQYANKEDLYRAKAIYYEQLFAICADRLRELDELRYTDDFTNYFWIDNGKLVDANS